MCVCAHMHDGLCGHVWRRLPQAPLHFVIINYSGLELTISQLDWLASKTPGSPTPNDGLSGMSPHRLFRGCYRSELRFSCLHDKHISQ